MQNPLDMQGKVVIITGGARGVGAGITRCFLDAGARVAVVGRNQPEQLPAMGDNHAEFWKADVRDYDQMAACVESIVQKHGRLDVFVNNAGGSPSAESATASPRFSESIRCVTI